MELNGSGARRVGEDARGAALQLVGVEDGVSAAVSPPAYETGWPAVYRALCAVVARAMLGAVVGVASTRIATSPWNVLLL